MIWEEPTTYHIELDKALWALTPKGTSTFPLDVICCVRDFMVKETMMLIVWALCNFNLTALLYNSMRTCP